MNALNEAELAKIRVEYHIPDSVVMRIPRLLEYLSNPDGEVVFLTDAFKHVLWLPLRHSVQKILAQIGYAPGQFNPNFCITLLRMITAFGIADEGEPSYEQFTYLYSVTRAKSADQWGVSSGELPSCESTWTFRGGGAELGEDVAWVLVSGAWESAPGVMVERYIPIFFQTVGWL